MMPGVEVVLYMGAIGLLIIGLSGLLLVHNAFRMLLSLVMLEAGASLLLVLSGYRELGIAPIFLTDFSNAALSSQDILMNDPVPQALVLTAIVIGVGIQALALALLIKIKHYYGTLDMCLIRDKLEQDIALANGVSTPVSIQSPQAVVTKQLTETHPHG